MSLHVVRWNWRDHAITADKLQKKNFPPLREVVPGFVPEGLSILAGKPKIGKSWMALDMVSSGRDRRSRTRQKTGTGRRALPRPRRHRPATEATNGEATRWQARVASPDASH